MSGNAVKLTMRTVDALSTEHRDALFWDRDLAGFGSPGPTQAKTS